MALLTGNDILPGFSVRNNTTPILWMCAAGIVRSCHFCGSRQPLSGGAHRSSLEGSMNRR